MSIRHTVARVDLAALCDNLRAVQRRLTARAAAEARRPPGIVAVVKANAYGHGATRVALALEAAGARQFAVADIEEGIELRAAGVRGRILVFGALGVSDLAGVFEHDLTPTISTPSAARALEDAAAARGVVLTCQLEIDTGMHRLGFRFDNVDRTLPALVASRHLRIEAVFTHFATADDPPHPLFEIQRARFSRVLERLAVIGMRGIRRHAANSAALLRDPRVWFDEVRAGLVLYGVSPFVPSDAASDAIELRPVLTLTSRIVAVKGLRPGESVGYGGRFVADGARSLAVVPAGYADGLDYRLGDRGSVLVRGNRVPIVGSVCMDMITIDVSGLDVAPGDEVVIVGRQGAAHQGVAEMAHAIGTIPYELLCRIGARIERVYDSP